jgi:membrane protease YdiL (CAAX protease family)
MRRLIAPWSEIVREFNWLVLALLLVYSAVAVLMVLQTQNTQLLSNTILSLIRLAAWLTIIATLIPQNGISIPVRRPLPELIYLCLWGLVEAVALMYFWGWSSPSNLILTMIQPATVIGNLALAIVFARVFRYSASDLGIPLKHWRLYLGLIVGFLILMNLAVAIITPVFPALRYFLRSGYFNISVGMLTLLTLFVLYLGNRKRWQGLADDLNSFRPFALPIILCALVTVGLAWALHGGQFPWSLALRTFDTSTMVQGAIPEEFYYRLGLQTRLASFMPFGWASLLQGIAFSASHFPQNLAVGYLRPSDLPWSFTPGIVNALAGGFFWGRSKNLPATILFHMAVYI